MPKEGVYRCEESNIDPRSSYRLVGAELWLEISYNFDQVKPSSVPCSVKPKSKRILLLDKTCNPSPFDNVFALYLIVFIGYLVMAVSCTLYISSVYALSSWYNV